VFSTGRNKSCKILFRRFSGSKKLAFYSTMNLHDISNFAKVIELSNDLCGLLHSVEACLYKPEGRGFDSLWGNWNLSLI